MTPVPAWSTPRTAIVTGGGSGIGIAIATRLAQDGASVAIFDRNGDSAVATADAIVADGGTAIGVTVDVSSRDQIEAGVAEVRDRLGAATILINNAGISPFSRFLKISQEEFEQVFAVNVRGIFDLCQVVLPDMIEAGWGRIVNISSSSAQTGNAGQVHYSASKGAVISMTRSLAKEFGPKGITVNAVPPSFVDTPALRDAEDRACSAKASRSTSSPRRCAGRQARGHRGGVRILRPRRLELHHGPGARGQRRPCHRLTPRMGLGVSHRSRRGSGRAR